MNPFELPLLPPDIALVEIGRAYVAGSLRDRLFIDRDARVTAAVHDHVVRLVTRVHDPQPAVVTVGIPVLGALAAAARYWARERDQWAPPRPEVRCGSLRAVNLTAPSPPRRIEPLPATPIAPEALRTARVLGGGRCIGEIYRLPDDVELTAKRYSLDVRRGDARIRLRPGAERFLAELVAVLAPELADRALAIAAERERDPFEI